MFRSLSFILLLLFVVFSLGCAKTTEVRPQPQAQQKKVLSPEEQKKQQAEKLFMDGLIDMQHGALDTAVKHFREALKLDPDSYNARLYLADVYGQQKNHMLALDQYEKMIKINPKDPRAYNGAISSYIDMALLKMALGVKDEAEKNGVDPAGVAASLGWVYYLSGDYENARKSYELIKGKGNETLVTNNLGLISFSEGKYAEALGYFKEAVEKNPDSIVAPYFVALAETKLGHEDEAIKALKEGIKRDPKLEDKVAGYNAQFFPGGDPGDLSPLFAKIKAEQEKEKPAEGQKKEAPAAASGTTSKEAR